LQRAVLLHVEPLPSVLDNEEQAREGTRTGSKARVHRALLAGKKAPLTEKMIPASIAERALPADVYPTLIHQAAHALAEESVMTLERAETALTVGLLLDMAPSAVALLAALAMLEGNQAAQDGARRAQQKRRDGQPVGSRKPNYSRVFRAQVFYWLASAYWHSFRQEPDLHVKVGDPGPAAN
jgi:hypothetical protein